MANFVSRRQFTIEWGRRDAAATFSASRFFGFLDWGRGRFLSALARSRGFAAARILDLPLVDTGARFLAPARFGDLSS